MHSLPVAEPLPLVWSDAELALLAGTGIGERARTRRAQLEDTWQKIGACAAEADDAGEASDALRTFQLPDWRAFVHTETITSSRAFYVDDVHGEALVPFADLLNQKKIRGFVS